MENVHSRVLYGCQLGDKHVHFQDRWIESEVVHARSCEGVWNPLDYAASGRYPNERVGGYDMYFESI